MAAIVVCTLQLSDTVYPAAYLAIQHKDPDASGYYSRDGKRESQGWRVVSCRYKPARKADNDHYRSSLPELQEGDFFFEPIEFGHPCT